MTNATLNRKLLCPKCNDDKRLFLQECYYYNNDDDDNIECFSFCINYQELYIDDNGKIIANRITSDLDDEIKDVLNNNKYKYKYTKRYILTCYNGDYGAVHNQIDLKNKLVYINTFYM